MFGKYAEMHTNHVSQCYEHEIAIYCLTLFLGYWCWTSNIMGVMSFSWTGDKRDIQPYKSCAPVIPCNQGKHLENVWCCAAAISERLSPLRKLVLPAVISNKQAKNRADRQRHLVRPVSERLNHLDFNESREDWVAVASAKPLCKSFVPHTRQVTTPATHHSIFTGWMLFLTTNQQCQSAEASIKMK